MSTFIHVLSFPFWFFGIIFVLAGLTGGVKRNGIKASGRVHLAVAIIAFIPLMIAYAMVQT